MRPLPRWGTGGVVGRDDSLATLSVSLDGKDISQVYLYGLTITLNTTDYKVLGIGNVWTASRFRKNGFAQRLLENAYAFSQIHKLAGTCLFSLKELVPYYTKCNYLEMTGPKEMMQPSQNGLKNAEVPSNVHFLVRLPNHVFGDESVVIRSLPW